MSNPKFESLLANFCSPVLMNKKVSNLMSIARAEIPEVESLIEYYNQVLKKFDLIITKVCECKNRVLVLVYKESLLKEHLEEDSVRSILDRFGYKGFNNIEDYINLLRERMQDENFPHEIGIFLGYPIQDVIGFIDNRGKNYKYCGYWKVYKDINYAKGLFSIYDNVKEYISKKISNGETLENVLNQSYNHLNIA